MQASAVTALPTVAVWTPTSPMEVATAVGLVLLAEAALDVARTPLVAPMAVWLAPLAAAATSAEGVWEAILVELAQSLLA